MNKILVDFANSHRNGSSVKKAVTEGIDFDPSTGKAIVKGQAFKLNTLQQSALVIAALQQTFSVRDNNAAFASFNVGNVDRLTDDKKSPVIKLPETIEDLTIEQVLSVLDGDKIMAVPLTISNQIKLGLYTYTKEDTKALQDKVDSIQLAARWFVLIHEYFGIVDASLVETSSVKMVFECSQTMAKFQRSYSQVKDFKDRGWYVDPSSATHNEALTDMLFTLELDLVVFNALDNDSTDTDT